MQGVINRQVGEVFLIENEREIPYEQLLGSLKGIGFKKSLLYLFQGNIKNYGTSDWMPPASMRCPRYRCLPGPGASAKP